MDEIDVWRAAQLLIRQHGDLAELEATKHSLAMAERGDTAGEAVWTRVLRTIEKLRKTSPRAGTKPQ